jgi:hypothetical protein
MGKPSCRPDGVTDSSWVDIKATNQGKVYMTQQQQLELAGAEAESKQRCPSAPRRSSRTQSRRPSG